LNLISLARQYSDEDEARDSLETEPFPDRLHSATLRYAGY
jgi:hypothetical protein